MSIRLPVPGGDHPEVMVMRTVEDSIRLQKNRIGRPNRRRLGLYRL